MNRLTTYGVFATLIVLLAGCSIFGDKDKTDEEREKARLLSEQQLYERVQEYLDDEKFDLAVKNLQLLESRFPFGVYADQSQLEIVYAYYRNNDEDAAIAAADRFLRLHPRHPDADYAWYMKGLANYSLAPGLLSRFYEADQSARDVASARRSFREFQEFLRRYPDSVYAADARVRMVNIKDVLARHELVVANYYVKRRAYTAAINRAKAVVEQYQKTEAVADAFALLVFSYHRLGLTDLVDDNLAVLKANFPNHPSLDANGDYRYDADFDLDRRSWLNRLSLGLLDAPRAPIFDTRDAG
ncbi:MAG: outer membrane protein assembly factor BamD [Pseudomonadales bacterium]|nr:outer membrane protein assembly factor BamD [Pseudomonadales bacterium]